MTSATARLSSLSAAIARLIPASVARRLQSRRHTAAAYPPADAIDDCSGGKYFLFAALLHAYSAQSLVRAVSIPVWLVDDAREDAHYLISAHELALLYPALVVAALATFAIMTRVREDCPRRVRVLGVFVICSAVLQVALTVIGVTPFIVHLRREHTLLALRDTYTMGFFACVTSILTGLAAVVFLAIDAHRFGFANEDLTVNQRNLISANVYAISMFVVGAFAFAYFETWDYGSAYLFCIAALTTIGYGDKVPRSVGGIVFTFAYTLLGLAITYYFLMAIRRAFVERMDIGAQKVFLKRIQLKKARSAESSPVTHASPLHDIDALTYHRARKFSISTFRNSTPATAMFDEPLGEEGVVEPEYLKLSQKEQDEMLRYIRRRRLMRLVAYWFLHWFAGALIFLILEHHEDERDQWSFFDSLWFTFATLTTMGFGDITPSTPVSWEFWSLFVFWSISTFAYVLSVAGDNIRRQFREMLEHEDEFLEHVAFAERSMYHTKPDNASARSFDAISHEKRRMSMGSEVDEIVIVSPRKGTMERQRDR